MKELYNAGSMFNEAQWNTRKAEGKNLRTAFPTFKISNPVDFDTNQGNTPTALQIWDADYDYVKNSDYVIFEIDSFDLGTIMEFAVAVEMAKATQPNKFLIPVISDFRFKQASSIKQLPEFSINHFVYGAIFDTQLNQENRIYLAKSHTDAIKMIQIREEYLKNKDERYLQELKNLDMKYIYDDGNMYK